MNTTFNFTETTAVRRDRFSPATIGAGSLSVALVACVLSAAGCSEHEPTPAILVARDPLDLPPPLTRTEPTAVTIELTAREVFADIGDGKKAWVWTFDGTVPGPLIRVIEGDQVTLRLRNDPANVEPHSIDLHAVLGMGGGADLTEVGPGETAEVTFVAQRQGLYFYHCAAEGAAWEHVAHGMYGAILVEPPGGLPPVAREAYVTQGEWYLRRGSGAAGHEEEEEEGEHGLPFDVWDVDAEAAARGTPTFYTFNGHRDALASSRLFGERIQLRAGERVRILFANAGPNLPSSFHVVGGIFDLVYGGAIADASRDEETVLVPPGSATAFELTLPVPGPYMMIDHALYHAAMGASGMLHVSQ